VTNSPSSQTRDQWSDAATRAGYVPPTVASRAVAQFDVTASTAARQPYVPDLAWSAEPPEFAAPLPPGPSRSRFMRSGVLAFVGGGLVAAAATGVFVALHGADNTAPDTTSHSAPAAAPATAPTAAPASTASMPANQAKPAVTTRSVTSSRRSSGATSHQSPPQNATPPWPGQQTNDQQWQNTNPQQWPSNHDSVSTPPTWNLNDNYWFTHRHDDDSRWTNDHDSDDRPRSDHGNNSQSSHDQSGDTHSTGSDGNESSE
jgi:hypothetical protein